MTRFISIMLLVLASACVDGKSPPGTSAPPTTPTTRTNATSNTPSAAEATLPSAKSLDESDVAGPTDDAPGSSTTPPSAAPGSAAGKTAGPTSQVVAFFVGSLHSDEQEGLGAQVIFEPPIGYARSPALEITLERPGEKPLSLAGTAAPGAIDHTFPIPVPAASYKVHLDVDGVRWGTIRGRKGQTEMTEFPAPILKFPEWQAPERCAGVRCPSYPALSPDGAVLVSRDAEHVVSESDFCRPPVAEFTRYWTLDDQDASWTASHPLDGYELLTCDQEAKLPGGLVARLEDDQFARIVDASGKEVTSYEWYGSGAELCPSKKHRVVIVRINEGMGGDCEETSTHAYAVLRY